MNILKCDVSFPDGLELIPKKHELRIHEIALEDHQLRLGVILYLVDADIFCRAVALTGQRHLQVKPLDRGQLLRTKDSLSDVIHVQPSALADHLEGTAVIVLNAVFLSDIHPAVQRATGHGLFRCIFCTIRKLFLVLLVRILLRTKHTSCLLQKLVNGYLNQTNTCGKLSLMSSEGLQNFLRTKDRLPLLIDRNKILLLKREALQCLVDSPQGLRRRFHARIRNRIMHHLQEFRPCQRVRIALAKIRKHVVNILRKDRIQSNQIHILRLQRGSLMEEHEGNPLQEDRRLSASRDSVDKKHRHIRITDDGILLLLNGNRNRLHLIAVLSGERCQKHRILDRKLRVKISLQLILIQLKLAAQQKIYVDSSAVHLVEGFPVLLIVIGLRDGRSPVDNQLIIAVLRNRASADVVILRLLVRRELKRHSGKIRRLQQHLQLRKLRRHRSGFDVIGVDVPVPRLHFPVGLHLHLIIRSIDPDVRQNIRLLLCRLLIQCLNALLKLSVHGNEFVIGFGQVLLFFVKYSLIHSNLKSSLVICPMPCPEPFSARTPSGILLL